MDPLRSRTCSKCGATLPARSANEKTIICAHCGTTYDWLETNASANMEFSASGGAVIQGGKDVTIIGDVVGGNRVVVNEQRGLFTWLGLWIAKLSQKRAKR